MQAWARRQASWAPLVAVLAICSGGLVFLASFGDYPIDAGPAMDAVVAGHVQRFLALQPLMGSFAMLARAPFALAARLAGGDEFTQYRAGVLPCVLAAAALGIALVRRRGVGPQSLLLVPVLAVLTPASVAAVRVGHPEEILAGALCVAAVLLAGRRSVWAGVALGLAVATKQWAILAVVPVIVAAPRRNRLKLAALAGGVALVLTVPLIAGNVSAFGQRSHQAATAPATTGRATVWFLTARPLHLKIRAPAGVPSEVTVYKVSAVIARGSHPLIIVLGFLLGILAWRRRGDPLALLALLLLLRCVLDPVDNEYYHAPFVLALLAYETVRRSEVRGIPLITLFSVAGLWLTFDQFDVHGAAPALTNAVYLAWTTAVMIYLLFGSNLVRRRRALSTMPSALRWPYIRQTGI